MRYFLTTNAQAPVVVAGRSFVFEPLTQMGGSWLGVLAVADEASANILAAGARHDLEELTEAEYSQKKKPVARRSDSLESATPRPAQNPALAIADPVGPPSGPLGVNNGPNSTEMITAVTLLATDRKPPAETLLDGSGNKKSHW